MIDDLKAAISSFLILCGNQWTLLFFCIAAFVVDRFFASVLLIDGILVVTVVVTWIAIALIAIRLRDQLRKQ